MSPVERVRQVRITWGRNAPVVHIPATDPTNDIQDIAMPPRPFRRIEFTIDSRCRVKGNKIRLS